MSSSAVARAPRRQADRAADTVARLAAAAVEELGVVGYDRLTVRAVARRAGVAPATAYTWFASKDHLVAEAFWRALQALPPPRPLLEADASTRVRAAMDGIGRLSAEDAALAAAATAALLASDPDVARLRRRIGAAVHQRIVEALGDDAEPAIVDTLDMVFAGALLHAGLGLFPYSEFADRMARVTALLTGGRR